MSYVYAGYGVTFAVLVAYALRVLARGRALRRALPPVRALQQLPTDER